MHILLNLFQCVLCFLILYLSSVVYIKPQYLIALPVQNSMGFESSVSRDGVSGVYLGERHIMIVEPTQDSIFMTYFFSVHNSELASINSRVSLLYPQNIYGIQPLSGVTDSDVVFIDGRFYLEKLWEPGHTVISLRYSVPYSGAGEQILKFIVVEDLLQLSFIQQKRLFFVMDVEQFVDRIPHVLDAEKFIGKSNTNSIRKGDSLLLVLSSLPISAWRYYVLALCFGVLMIVVTCIAGYAAFRSRHQQHCSV